MVKFNILKKSAEKCSEGNTGTSSHSKSKASRYCFTSFDEEPPNFDEKRMKYLCYAPEKCPSTGKAHWQGFVVWAKGHDCAITACAKRLNKAHVDICKGTVDENVLYIKGPYTKGDKHKPANPDFVECGEVPAQGARKDLIVLKDAIMNGKTVDDLCVENPVMVHQYGRTLDRIEDIRLRGVKRTEMTKGIWLHGPTGCGKTETAEKLGDGDVYYWKQEDNGWQDGYRGQHTVIIDDFRGGIKFASLLRMVDKYANFEAPRRGKAPMPFTSKQVIITSSMAPAEVYNNLAEGDKLAQLFRRFEVREHKPRDPQRTIDDFNWEVYNEITDDPLDRGIKFNVEMD